MKILAQGFNTAAQGSNPGSRSRESEALPLSHCSLQNIKHGNSSLDGLFINISEMCKDFGNYFCR